LDTCTYTLSTFIPSYLVLVLKYFDVVLMASLIKVNPNPIRKP